MSTWPAVWLHEKPAAELALNVATLRLPHNVTSCHPLSPFSSTCASPKNGRAFLVWLCTHRYRQKETQEQLNKARITAKDKRSANGAEAEFFFFFFQFFFEFKSLRPEVSEALEVQAHASVKEIPRVQPLTTARFYFILPSSPFFLKLP